MKEQQEGYISNEYLRDLIIKYNRKNIDDTGNWCGPYRSKLNNKYAKAKEERPIILAKLQEGNLPEKEEKELKKKLSKLMTDEQYQASLNFITKKEKYIPELREMYMKLSSEERRHYNYELDLIKKEICEAFMKVINGRIISFKLIQTPAYEDVEDIRQECMMTLFMYINRYDETRNSSAFAFVTQLITNAINLYLNEMNEHKDKEISGLDFYENLNTIDDPYGGDN
jgi:hypothetical protein